MLQTEEIDDDYFTPASSTSLANIFGKSRNEDVTENETLKYTPPKPSYLTPKPTEQKATQCIFACALLGYEWSNGAYITRGKLGFAIMNIVKTGAHSVILYDSKKITLSSATVSMNLEVTVKENSYFSYSDDQQKYWCLYATDNEVNKVVSLLKDFNVKIKYSTEEDKGPAEVASPSESLTVIQDKTDIAHKESDTDSSLNRKTKTSIINRMANMGHSVLPPRVMAAEKSSDSSDTNDTSQYKTVRHKPIKNVVKRNNSDKSVSECQTLIETQKIIPRKEHSTESMPLFTYVNGQLVPVTNTNIITSSSVSSSNDMTYFISEQRINNSELRINMNRISDKIDQVLSKVSKIDSEDNSSSSNFQIDLLKKLLAEYENKIKVYEEFIKGTDKNFNISQVFGHSITQHPDTVKEADDKIQKLQQLCHEKDAKISSLESEMDCLKQKYNESMASQRLNIEKLSQNVQTLNQEIAIKNKEYSDLMDKYEKLDKLSKTENDNDVGTKIKNVMNDTFRAIAANFENDESYSGERVKSVTATVIKRVTIESLGSI